MGVQLVLRLQAANVEFVLFDGVLRFDAEPSRMMACINFDEQTWRNVFAALADSPPQPAQFEPSMLTAPSVQLTWGNLEMVFVPEIPAHGRLSQLGRLVTRMSVPGVVSFMMLAPIAMPTMLRARAAPGDLQRADKMQAQFAARGWR